MIWGKIVLLLPPPVPERRKQVGEPLKARLVILKSRNTQLLLGDSQ